MNYALSNIIYKYNHISLKGIIIQYKLIETPFYSQSFTEANENNFSTLLQNSPSEICLVKIKEIINRKKCKNYCFCGHINNVYQLWYTRRA